MDISQMTTAVMVFLTGLLPASCHKTADAKHQSRQPSAVAGATNAPTAKILERNLGDITLTNNSDYCVQFDNGEYCTLTPKVLERSTVRITLAVESKNKY